MQQQQSPESSRNFILFLIITFLILGGWMALQSYLAPRPQVQQKNAAAKKAPPWPLKLRKGDEYGRLIALLAPAAPAAPLQTALRSASVQLFVPPPPIEWPVRLTEAADQGKLAATLAGAPYSRLQSALQWASVKLILPRKKTIKPTPSLPIAVAELGGPDWYLHAKLTNRGAGLQKLTLTKFKAADWFGEPKYSAGGQPAPLVLIQEDPVNPSFRMYHYPDPDTYKEVDDEDKRAELERPLNWLGETNWKLEKESKTDEEHSITYITGGPPGWKHLQIRKTFTLRPKWYHIGLKIEIIDKGNDIIDNDGEGKKDVRKPFRYQLTGAHGMPIEGAWYTYVHRNAMIGEVDRDNVLRRSLQQSREVAFWRGGNRFPPTHPKGHLIPYAAVVTQYFASAVAVDSVQKEGVDPSAIVEYARPTNESREWPCTFRRFNDAAKQVRLTFSEEVPHGLGSADDVDLLPRAEKQIKDKNLKENDKIVADLYPYYENGKKKWIVGRLRRGTITNGKLEDLTVRVVSEPVSTSAGSSVTHQFVLYNGPVKTRQLTTLTGSEAVDYKLVEKYAATLHLDSLTDYPTIPWLSDLYVIIIKIMHWLLDTLYWLLSFLPFSALIPTEALAIILLIILVRGAMFPVSWRQQRMSIKMQQLAPEMKQLREKYKDDPQQMQKEIWALYRKHGANPIGGCLPMLLQLPIFIGLYYSLQESIRFRLAPFLWIKNLAAPDMLFKWGQGIPWISNPDSLGSFLYLGPYFNLLPIIAVTIMIVSQKLMMPPPTDEQQEMQQKMMKYMMVVFGLMFYKVAAGLCIYFIASSLWGITERRLLPKKKMGVAAGGAGPSPPSTNNVPAKPGKPKPATAAIRRKERKKQRGKQPEKPKSLMQQLREQWDELLKQAKKK